MGVTPVFGEGAQVGWAQWGRGLCEGSSEPPAHGRAEGRRPLVAVLQGGELARSGRGGAFLYEVLQLRVKFPHKHAPPFDFGYRRSQFRHEQLFHLYLIRVTPVCGLTHRQSRQTSVGWRQPT